MRLKPVLFILSLTLSLGAVAQTNVVTAPSNAVVSFTIGDMPGINSPSAADGTLGTPFNYQITGFNSPTSYSASGLPAGLNVNTAGLIWGTPTAFGVFSVTLSATNATGTTSTTFTLTIANFVDSDGDGIDDAWEMAQFGNLTTCNATSRNNLDGLLDRDEYRLGLDPTKNNLTAQINTTNYEYNLRNELTKCAEPIASAALTFSPDAEGNLK